MTPAQKQWIDEASYEDMLRRWRMSPIGDEIFQGAAGDYFAEVMAEKRKKAGDAEHTAASKRIGWG